MSIKTIAVDARVYARLAASRREGESFSKAIDRLLNDAADAHTGHDVLSRLAESSALSDAEADHFLAVVAENRGAEGWERHDLR
jgi:predicted CopG family antitoxin